jgi:hypothetical protein
MHIKSVWIGIVLVFLLMGCKREAQQIDLGIEGIDLYVESKVTIPFEKQSMPINTINVVRVGVKNSNKEPTKFALKVRFNSLYSPNGTLMTDASGDYIDENWILTDEQRFEMAPGQVRMLNITIRVGPDMDAGKKTLSGTYVFDVFACSPGCLSYEKGDPNLYDGYVHKFYVQVP